MKNKLTFLIVGVIWLVLVLACGQTPQSNQTSPTNGTTNSANGTSKSEPTKPEAIKVTATELLKAYNDNKVKADETYKDKNVLLSGTIDTIGKDIMDYPYVTLKAGDMIYSIQVYFTDAENSKLGSLKKGQKITVLGKCTGSLGNVMVKEAVMQ